MSFIRLLPFIFSGSIHKIIFKYKKHFDNDSFNYTVDFSLKQILYFMFSYINSILSFPLYFSFLFF